MEKVGLVFPGGGSRGAFQVGVCQYIADHNVLENGAEYSGGASVGAFHSLAVAHFPSGPVQMKQAAAKMQSVWAQVKTDSDVWKKHFPPYLSALWKNSIGDNAPLRALIESAVDVDAVRRSNVEWTASGVNLYTGELRYFTKLDPIISSAMASGAYPLAFPPEKIDGQLWSDGSLRDTNPLAPAIAAGCTRIIVIPCANPWSLRHVDSNYIQNIVGMGTRCIAIALNELLRNDIEHCLRINKLVKADSTSEYRHIDLDVIVPVEPMSSSLDFQEVTIQKQIDQGYRRAASYFSGDGDFRNRG